MNDAFAIVAATLLMLAAIWEFSVAGFTKALVLLAAAALIVGLWLA
jgi:hypothetical protein